VFCLYLVVFGQLQHMLGETTLLVKLSHTWE
jgi:hypothetical protein